LAFHIYERQKAKPFKIRKGRFLHSQRAQKEDKKTFPNTISVLFIKQT